MSISGRKLICASVVSTAPDSGEPIYRTDYTVTPTPLNGHDRGAVLTPVGGLTESTFNLQVQQAVADKANQETSNVDQFVSGDVFGGRL